MASSEKATSKECDGQFRNPVPAQASRFVVSTCALGVDNPILVNKSASEVDDLKVPSMSTRRESRRLSIPEFFSSLLPGNVGLSSRRTSRANSIFSDFFRDADSTVMDYTQEAAPRLENYRNSLTMHKYMIRPSLDELHEAQQESRPSLEPGKGQNTGAVKFGWVKGVYIRCLLNIWGVMLFLRMGWMTGQCGILLAIVIVLLSTVVTVITTVSMSAIGTNGYVRGGGAYYMISRSLGPEFGGVVGIVLFLANAVSGSMYIIGAGETIRDILQEFHTGIVQFPSSTNDIRVSSIITLLLMMTITGIGMAFENKTQMVLLLILLVAMVDYFVGACIPPTLEQKAKGFVGWNLDVAVANLGPHFRGETFFSVFAIFFPSVTGILAGANISGDLKDASSAIPKGTLLSILTTSVSYIVVVIFLGFTVVQDATGDVNDFLNNTFQNCQYHHGCDFGLLNDNQVMKMSSAFGPIIYAGIFAATLSSALVSIVSAPRILQALCLDGIIPWLNWLGKGYGPDNDPRRGLALTFVITLVFILFGDLNAVAPIISNFFMAANGLINFSCFHASYVKSPGFRPSFKYYNLWVSLFGSILCVAIMFVMNWITALVTFVVVVALYVYINKTCPEINWGSSFQGYSYRNALYYLNKLSRVEEHVKNYRPAVLVLTGNPCSRPQLVDLASLLTKDHGLQICGHISKEPHSWNVRRRFNELNTQWLNKKKLKAFYSFVESDSLCNGVSCLFQAAGIGKMKPNILLVGLKNNWETCEQKEILDYFNTVHEALDAHVSLAILRLKEGTDYSKYFESPDGFPLVKDKKKGKVSKEEEGSDKIPTESSQSDVIICLETVIEEPGSPGSVASPPSSPQTQMKTVQSRLTSAAEICQQFEETEYAELEISSPQKEESIPQQVLDVVNMFQTKQKAGTIDVWWLYDDGGLTVLLPYILTTRSKFKDCKLRVFSVAQDDQIISDEQLNLAALLHKFRIPFSDLTMLSSLSEPLHERSTRYFEKIITKWITKEEKTIKNPVAVTRSDLNFHKKKTNQYLHMRELLEKHSAEANFIVMTLPLPRKESCPAPLYLAWLEILTHDMPPFLLVRGNQTSVLTFYS